MLIILLIIIHIIRSQNIYDNINGGGDDNGISADDGENDNGVGGGGDTATMVIHSLMNEDHDGAGGNNRRHRESGIRMLTEKEKRKLKITAERMKEYEAYISDQSHNFTVIKCHNYKDMYTLVYNICLESNLCSELFRMDKSDISYNKSNIMMKTASNIHKNNFKKFVYQLSLTQLFIIHDHNVKKKHPNNTFGVTDESIEEDGEFLLDQQLLEKQQQSNIFFWEDNWPPQWVPRYIIELNNTRNESAKCQSTFNMYSTENINFIHSTLYLLQVFKTFVVNEYQCSDFNERLVLDVNNQPECVCAYGKSCDNESNTNILIIVIMSIFLVLLLLQIISTFWSTRKIVNQIHIVNLHKAKVS